MDGNLSDSEDLLDFLGVNLPQKGERLDCGHKAPREKPKRFTEWSNAQSFRFGGYLARIHRTRCTCCGSVNESFEGIFTEEIAPNGTRRLQALTRGAQWPAEEGQRLEVVEGETPLCVRCVRDLGFDREVAAPRAYSLIVK